jgi:hypothetical protein
VKFESPGAPPARLNTCDDEARFVTTTSIPADVLPTVVVGNASVVGVIEKPGVAVPVNEIVPELWPLTVKFVVAACAPGVWGANAYVTLQDAPAANVTPAQA